MWKTGCVIEDKGNGNPQCGHEWTIPCDRHAPGEMGTQSRVEQEDRELQGDKFDRIFCMIKVFFKGDLHYGTIWR